MEKTNITPEIQMKTSSKDFRLVISSIGFILIIGAISFGVYNSQFNSNYNTSNNSRLESEITEYKKFESDIDFIKYIEEGRSSLSSSFLGGDLGNFSALSLDRAQTGIGDVGESSIPSRVSQTNVQVQGIDEPDIVKTNAETIFYSPENFYYRYAEPLLFEDRAIGIPPETIIQKTKIVDTLPASNVSEIGEIPQNGTMLLSDNTLVLFANTEIYGFDVSNQESTVEKWKISLDENVYVQTARLYDGYVYIVTQKSVFSGSPCPIPLTTGSTKISVPCTDIWYPSVPADVDSTYTIIKLDPDSGVSEKTMSFVGASGSSNVYMSESAIYISNNIQESYSTVMLKLINESASDLFPSHVTEKLARVNSYDISESSKFQEFTLIIESYKRSLSSDEKAKIETEFVNRANDFSKKHLRDFTKTSIAKISLENFSIDANGVVPGSLLNQFSMDEYKSNLRVATTVGGGWFGSGQSESKNDVYVLDSSLQKIGEVLDLGVGERIYSARFIGDKAYLVTFKQIDPFYVLDMSDPKAPQVKGELKIPGYSSYLHPLTSDRILGVGRDELGMVKLSLFDVSDASNPKEINKYSLNEYWSEALDNHKAFLQDEKYKVIFIPGGNGGYVISYEKDQLTLKKVVTEIQAKRALFINNHLYVVGESGILVLNEDTWEQTSKLEFK